MTENERLKYLRVNILKMTLEQFGDGINVKKGTLSPIENGKNRITDKMRSLICEKYNVSEHWLLYGEGEPLLPTDRRQQLHAWADKVLADSPESFRYRFVDALSRLPDEWWSLTEKAAIDILSEYDPEKAEALRSASTAADREKMEIDRKVEEYRAELEASAASRKSAASQTGSEDIVDEA